MKLAEIARKVNAPAVVAGAAFLASAGHIVSVVDETNHIIFALAYPLGIDGLLYVGMKALKERRFAVGVIALVVGTFFSLAFNAHAEGAIQVPRIIIAFSMPICLLAAFVIEHIGKRTAEIAEKIVEIEKIVEVEKIVEREVRVYPELLPIVPLPIRAEATVEQPKAKAVDAPEKPKAITSGGRSVRVAAWDVEKAVRLIADGRTDSEIADAVGTNAKAIQRTKSAVRLLTLDASRTDEEVAEMMKKSVSPAHVGRVRAAMIQKENA